MLVSVVTKNLMCIVFTLHLMALGNFITILTYVEKLN